MVACDDEVSVGGEQTRLKTRLSYSTRDLTALNYNKAQLYYEQSLEMKRHVYGPESKNTDLAETLHNLGLLEKMIGNYDKAREKLEEALAMANASSGAYASMHLMVENIRKNLEACKV